LETAPETALYVDVFEGMDVEGLLGNSSTAGAMIVHPLNRRQRRQALYFQVKAQRQADRVIFPEMDVEAVVADMRNAPQLARLDGNFFNLLASFAVMQKWIDRSIAVEMPPLTEEVSYDDIPDLEDDIPSLDDSPAEVAEAPVNGKERRAKKELERKRLQKQRRREAKAQAKTQVAAEVKVEVQPEVATEEVTFGDFQDYASSSRYTFSYTADEPAMLDVADVEYAMFSDQRLSDYYGHTMTGDLVNFYSEADEPVLQEVGADEEEDTRIRKRSRARKTPKRKNSYPERTPGYTQLMRMRNLAKEPEVVSESAEMLLPMDVLMDYYDNKGPLDDIVRYYGQGQAAEEVEDDEFARRAAVLRKLRWF